jgi:hypothetical protein
MVSGIGLEQIKQAVISRFPLGYYNGTLYKIVYGDNGEAKFELSKESFKPWVVIVSRDYYQESLENLAVTDQRELKAVLKLNNNNEDFNSVYLVNTITDNQSYFNRWKFPKNLISAMVMLPEGLLLAKSESANTPIVVEDEEQESRVFVVASSNGLSSTKPTAVINSISRFCQSCGVSQQTPSTVISNKQLPTAFLNGLSNLSIKYWAGFWQAPYQSFNFTNIKSSLVMAMACVVLYLSASSGYLYWQQTQLEQQLQQGKSEVSEALDIQDKRNELKLQVEGLSQVVVDFKSKTVIWAILLPLFEEAKFDNIRYQDGRFILRGSAPKATVLLSKLVEKNGVTDAQFDLPVTSNRARESFTISFRWQPTKQEVSDAIAP